MADIDVITHVLCRARPYLYAVAVGAATQWPWLVPTLVLCAVVEGLHHLNQRALRRRLPACISSKDVALVTGGSQGLGREIVRLLLLKGCRVIVLDIEPYVPEAVPASNLVRYVPCDLASVERTQHIVLSLVQELASQSSHISILVNNAGVRHSGLFLGTDHPTLQHVFNVNTFSPGTILRTVLGSHVAQRSHQLLSVVNVSSILGSFGPCNLLAYSASKAAFVQLHECLSEEVRAYHEIRMLLVLPGQLDTAMFGDVVPSREFFAPVVNHRKLAQSIVDRVEAGATGVMCVPLYANVLPIMKVMPMLLQRLARWFSKMDEKVGANEPLRDFYAKEKHVPGGHKNNIATI